MGVEVEADKEAASADDEEAAAIDEATESRTVV